MNLPSWINPFNKVADLASELIVDKDQLHAFNHELESLKQDIYRHELNAKTLPWVDALHKMGRQIQIYVTMALVSALLFSGIELPPHIAALLGLPATAYTLVKGRGK